MKLSFILFFQHKIFFLFQLDCMNYRMITPYSDCPSLDDLFIDLDELENLSIDIDETITLTMKKQQSQQKRKQQNK